MSDEQRSIFDDAEPAPGTELDALAEWRRAEKWQARAERAESRVAELEAIIQSDPELSRRFRGRWRSWLASAFGIKFKDERARRSRRAHIGEVNKNRAEAAELEAAAPLPANHMQPRPGWSPVRELSPEEKRRAFEESEARRRE